MVFRYARLASNYTAPWGENARREESLGKMAGTVELDDAQKNTQVMENMGWLMGLEPTTTGITTRDSTN